MPQTSPRPYQPVNLAAKLAAIHEQWQPRVVAEMNDYQFKLVKLEGEFVWHSHADTDEAFFSSELCDAMIDNTLEAWA